MKAKKYQKKLKKAYEMREEKIISKQNDEISQAIKQMLKELIKDLSEAKLDKDYRKIPLDFGGEAARRKVKKRWKKKGWKIINEKGNYYLIPKN